MSPFRRVRLPVPVQSSELTQVKIHSGRPRWHHPYQSCEKHIDIEGIEKVGALYGAGTKAHMFLKTETGQSGESSQVRGISNKR